MSNVDSGLSWILQGVGESCAWEEKELREEKDGLTFSP